MEPDKKTLMLIPERLRVGFRERKDTYTGHLGYIIYYDKKNKLRKEHSWQTWRDDKIDPVECTNVPTEGFVLNKKVGGYSTGWNHRDTYVRVYDPRGFEFEITVANLLYILAYCDCSRGKGLEGKFVYAWEGKDLFLLPINTPIYQDSQVFTELQAKKVSARSLTPGFTYLNARAEPLLYLGKLDWWDVPHNGYHDKKQSHKKTHVFWDGEVFLDQDQVKLNSLHSDVIPPDYAERMSLFLKGPHGSRPVALEISLGTPLTPGLRSWSRTFWYMQESPTSVIECYRDEYAYTRCSYQTSRIRVTDQGLEVKDLNQRIDLPQNQEVLASSLWVVLESGSKFQYGGIYYGLLEPEATDEENQSSRC